MSGILVHGDNHFIVGGPLPDRPTALALARHWSLIEIGGTTPAALAQWSIRSKEFRENLEWAVIVPGDGEISPGGEGIARRVVSSRNHCSLQLKAHRCLCHNQAIQSETKFTLNGSLKELERLTDEVARFCANALSGTTWSSTSISLWKSCL